MSIVPFQRLSFPRGEIPQGETFGTFLNSKLDGRASIWTDETYSSHEEFRIEDLRNPSDEQTIDRYVREACHVKRMDIAPQGNGIYSLTRTDGVKLVLIISYFEPKTPLDPGAKVLGTLRRE